MTIRAYKLQKHDIFSIKESFVCEQYNIAGEIGDTWEVGNCVFKITEKGLKYIYSSWVYVNNKILRKILMLFYKIFHKKEMLLYVEVIGD